jgi:hypothetical protein
MGNEIAMMYPNIIIYALIASGVVLLVWRRKRKFKKGIIVANTKYVKKTGYFKLLNAKYHLYNILIKVVCIMIILLCAVVSARLYKVDKHDEEYNNRDIMLCMDFSGSVNALNKDIIETMIETVKSLKEERFGITIFDSTSINLVPLTSDYNYVIYNLELIKAYFERKKPSVDVSECNNRGDVNSILRCISDKTSKITNNYLNHILTYGTRAMPGSSLIGDGVASCANTFKDGDGRTKIIILSTDNMVAGTQTITVPQASVYAKKKDIKVYPIGTKSIKNSLKYKGGLIDLANETGGAYFDYEDYSTNEINKKIEELNKSAIIKTTYVTKTELPELIVPYLLWLLPVLFVLDWRVRI